MEDLMHTDIDVREIMKTLITISEQKDSDYEPEFTLNEKILYLSRIIRLRNTSYTIHSHRKIIGRLMVFFRKLIASENHRYIDPLLHQQNSVNGIFLEIIEHLVKENAELRSDIIKIKQDQKMKLR